MNQKPLEVVQDAAYFEAQLAKIQRRNKTPGRKCGECTACCTVLEVAELGKPSLTPCPHCAATNCTIYAQRPLSCAGFACDWLFGRHGLGAALRPDQLGLIFCWVETNRIRAYETRPGAALSAQGLKTLNHLKRTYEIALSFHDAQAGAFLTHGDRDARSEIEARAPFRW